MINEDDFIKGANDVYISLMDAFRKSLRELPLWDNKYMFIASNSAIGNFIASIADAIIKDANYEIKLKLVDDIAAFAKQRLKEVLIDEQGN